MFVAIAVLTLSLVFLTLFGILFQTAFFKKTDRKTLLISPFIGIAAVLIVAGNLVRCDFLMHDITYVLWGALVFFLLVSFIRHRKLSLVDIFALSEMPRKSFILKAGLILGAIIIVAATQGYCYFKEGINEYIGYGTRDMWNYTVFSQFLMDFPFSTTLTDANQNPLLPLDMFSKHERSGAMVIQAMIASLFGLNAKQAWGATSLIGPVLLVLPLWLISKEYGLRLFYRFIAVVLGGILPGIAWIHLENDFLSHALSLPFMMIWPYLVQRLLKKPNLQNIVTSAIIFFAYAYIYAEMTLILVMLSIVMTAWSFLQSDSLKLSLLKIAASLAVLLGLFLIPGYVPDFFVHITHANDMRSPFPPDGLTITGLMKIFTNYSFLAQRSDIFIHSARIFTILFVLLSLWGIFLSFLKERSVLTIGVLTMVCIPIIIACYPQPHVYQYYKTATTFAPILPIGFLYLCQWFNVGKTKQREGAVIKIVLYWILLFTLYLALRGTYFYNHDLASRSDYYFQNPTFISINQRLEKSHNKYILIKTNDEVSGAWFAYHGRNNHVWFTHDFYGDWAGLHDGINMRYLNMKTVPANAEIILFP
jgi:hypothetical protein